MYDLKISCQVCFTSDLSYSLLILMEYFLHHISSGLQLLEYMKVIDVLYNQLLLYANFCLTTIVSYFLLILFHFPSAKSSHLQMLVNLLQYLLILSIFPNVIGQWQQFLNNCGSKIYPYLIPDLGGKVCSIYPFCVISSFCVELNISSW